MGQAPAASIVAMFVLWQVLVDVLHVRSLLLPAPTAIFAALYDAPRWFLQEGMYTLETTLIGFALAVAVGILLAILIVEIRLLESTLYALIVALNSVPKVAIAPLFVIWLGTGPGPKIAIAFLIAFFPIVIDTVLGLKSVPKEMLDLAKHIVEQKSGSFEPDRFEDRYESALVDLINQKRNGLPTAKAAPKSGGNVINLSVAIGMRFHGWRGALAGLLGLIAGPSLVVIGLGVIYERTQNDPHVQHLFVGLAAAAAGLLIAMAVKIVLPLRHDPAAAIVALIGFIAIAILRTPLLPTMLVLTPIGIALAIRAARRAGGTR